MKAEMETLSVGMSYVLLPAMLSIGKSMWIMFVYTRIYIVILILHFIFYWGHVLVNGGNHFFLNNQPDAPIIQIYSVIKLYMFRASSLPIIRSFPLYILHW